MTKKLEGAGLRGQVAGETSLSTVGQIEGLAYRGHKIELLAEKSSFEEVAYLVLNRKPKIDYAIEKVKGKPLWTSIILFFFVGIYGGFIQAGVGFLMLLVLSGINNFTLVKSNAIKIVVTGIYTVFAVFIFVINDKMNWEYGLILAFGNAVGGWFTSRWSVSKGDGVVKIFLVIMVVIMAIKLWFFTD